MKVELIGYQQTAAEWLLHKLSWASKEATDQPNQTRKTLSLSAPTGAGKTVIMAAVVEAVLTGSFSGGHSPHHDPAARFLWLTDNAELNRQTLNRFIADTDLGSHQLVEIGDKTFKAPMLPAGSLCFLNIQKLGKKGLLAKRSDKRQHTFWDAMDATLEQVPGSTIVLLDEAHRGMTTKKVVKYNTIVQRFLVGHSDEAENQLMRAPQIVVGISATPQRFDTEVVKAQRALDPYHIGPEEVRRSGLLKHQVRLQHTPDATNVDATMAKAAALRRRCFAEQWAMATPGRVAEVRPALLMQVEDSSQKNDESSDTNLDQVIDAVDQTNAQFGDERWADNRFAHCFEYKKPIRVAGRDIRYIEPSAIADDPDVDVVLFKTALNTGWDCPRAEVLISYRVARDHTNIAQLIGRMVRAPLRRAIEGEFADLLNGVDLYLPRFDDQTLESVVGWLTGQDTDETTGPLATEVVLHVDMALNREIAEDTELRNKVEKALTSLPSYDPPPRSTSGPIRRLQRLGEMLERRSGGTPVLKTATEDAQSELVDALEGLVEQARASAEWSEARQSVTTVSVTTRTHTLGEATATNFTEGDRIEVSHEDLDRQAEQLNKDLGFGIVRAWIGRKCDWQSGTTSRIGDACADVLTACSERFETTVPIRQRLEKKADEIKQNWLRCYETQISKLPDSERQAIQHLVAPPLQAMRRSQGAALPTRITARRPAKSAPHMRQHLYVEASEKAEQLSTPVELNGWERQAVEVLALGKDTGQDTIAWFRNQRSGSPWHLAIPYETGKEEPQRLLFPDIIVLRRTPEGDVAVQVIDPHSLHLADAAAKLRGLARWAETVDGDPDVPVSSVIAVAGINGELVYRDLICPDARKAAATCRDPQDMLRWFSGAPVVPSNEEPALSEARKRNDSFDEIPVNQARVRSAGS